jgi:hypothetical protein
VYLSTNELAERWAMSPRTLANHRSLGIGVPYVKLGRVVRYRLADVLAAERAHVVGKVSA